MSSFTELLFWLTAGHAIADYPLQGEFVARLKNRHDALNQPPYPLGSSGLWGWGLGLHGLIHGAFVAFTTGYISLGIAETISHVVIDWLKCEKKIGFHTDQTLHILCKIVWAILAIQMGTPGGDIATY